MISLQAVKKMNVFWIIWFCFLFLTSSYAQSEVQKDKSLLEQLEEEEQNERTSKTYQGSSKRAKDSLKSARDRAKGKLFSCPLGRAARKIEDVKEYISRMEDLQTKLAASLERFTSQSIQQDQAIEELTGLINERNEITLWANGKVLGVCGRPKQTELIAKSSSATDILIEEYKNVFSGR
jgi:hypothetical protein